jgi:hypothetical protein
MLSNLSFLEIKNISPNFVALSFCLRCLSFAGYELDLAIMTNPTEDEQIMFDALFEGNWQVVLEKSKQFPKIEEKMIKLIALAAAKVLDRRFRSF